MHEQASVLKILLLFLPTLLLVPLHFFATPLNPLSLLSSIVCPFPLPWQTVSLKAVGESSVYWHTKEAVHWWFDGNAQDQSQGALCTVSPPSGSLGPGESLSLEVRIRPDSKRPGEMMNEMNERKHMLAHRRLAFLTLQLTCHPLYKPVIYVLFAS